MADYFYDALTGRRLTSAVALKGGKMWFSLHLDGVQENRPNPVLTTDPNATFAATPDPAVKELSYRWNDKEKFWVFNYLLDTAKILGPDVRSITSAGTWAASMRIDYSAAPPTDKAATRKKIVEEALSHVANAHYLWGTAGNTTDLPDGNPPLKMKTAELREISLDAKTTTRDKVLGIYMAFQKTFDGYNSCAGRCNRSGANFPRINSAQLDKYLKNIAELAPKATKGGLPPFFADADFYPRKYHFRNNIENNGNFVFGESCIGRRHFDCIGLVNYCYAKYFTKSNFSFSIEQIQDTNGQTGFIPVADSAPAMDADVIIPKDTTLHIAMLYVKADGSASIVQATQTEVGLTNTDAYVPDKWDRFRLLGTYLKDV